MRLSRSVIAGLTTMLCASSVLSPIPARAETAPVAASAWDGRCTDVLLVGVRGSGETIPYGTTVTRVRDGLRQALPASLGVTEVYVDYPAANPHVLSGVSAESLLLADTVPENEYHRSVDDGAQRLRGLVRRSGRSCPRQVLAIMAFSQGAEVVTRAFGDGATSTDKVASVVLVGDPTNAPERAAQASASSPAGAVGLTSSLHFLRALAHQAREEDGRPLRGVVSGAVALAAHTPDRQVLRQALEQQQLVLPPSWYAVSRSVCTAEDVVCDAGPALARIMLKASTLDRELQAARPRHAGYDAQILGPTLDAAANDIATRAQAEAAAARSQEESRRSQVRRWAPWLGAVGLTALVAGGAGVVVGMRWRRSRRVHRS